MPAQLATHCAICSSSSASYHLFPKMSADTVSSDDPAAQLDLGFEKAVKRYLDAWQHNGVTNSSSPEIQPTLHSSELFFDNPPPITPRCGVCTATMPTMQALCHHMTQQHAHFAAGYASLMPPFRAPSTSFCELCKVSCDTPTQLATHMEGQKHRKKADWQRAFESASATFESQGIQYTDSVWSCAFCYTTLNGQKAVMQHIEGNRHKRARDAALFRNSQNEAMVPTQQQHHLPLTFLHAAETSVPLSSDSAVHSLDPCLRPGLSMPRPRLPNATTPNFPCTICNISCNSLESLSLHLSSARHIRKAQLQSNPDSPVPVLKCDHCFMSFSSADNLNMHLSSAKHKRSVANATGDGGYEAEFSCNVCNIICTAAENLADHLASAKHKRRVASKAQASARANENDPGIQELYCKICDISCCAIENFNAHLNGKQHAKKVRMNAAEAAQATEQ